MSKHAHLTLLERNIIYTGIRNNHKLIEIAHSINKDASTVSKEIKLHRYMSYLSSLKMQCANYKTCKYNRECFLNCPDYIEFKCKRRDKSPGARMDALILILVDLLNINMIHLELMNHIARI